MPTTYTQSGELIRELRGDLGWTQDDMSAEILRQLGHKYATSARTIARTEDGHRPSVRKQFAIAKVLGRVPSDFWGLR